MSMLALAATCCEASRLRLSGATRPMAMRGWKSATLALETFRIQFERETQEKFYLIADERDRASEIAFYLHDKRSEGPGHPPCYIVESQDVVNQISFWPRYDEFVERPPGTPIRKTRAIPKKAASIYLPDEALSTSRTPSAKEFRTICREVFPGLIVSLGSKFAVSENLFAPGTFTFACGIGRCPL